MDLQGLVLEKRQEGMANRGNGRNGPTVSFAKQDPERSSEKESVEALGSPWLYKSSFGGPGES